MWGIKNADIKIPNIKGSPNVTANETNKYRMVITIDIKKYNVRITLVMTFLLA